MNSNKNEFEKLQYIFLPPQFITKKYIYGEDAPSCNYEEYIVELLNCSTYFLKRTNGVQFELIRKQNHGEPDVNCNGFSLDFKLIGGESAITSKRHTSQSIKILSDGGVGYGLPDGRKDKYEVVQIHLALGKCSCNDLIQLKKGEIKKDTIKKDILSILKTLETKKNLLLFLPYVIITDGFDKSNSVTITTKVLEDCFGASLEYRKRIIPSEETFFCCIHNQQMLFYIYEDKQLKLVDSIYTYKSNTFRKLSRYISIFERNTIEAIIGEEYLYAAI